MAYLQLAATDREYLRWEAKGTECLRLEATDTAYQPLQLELASVSYHRPPESVS